MKNEKTIIYYTCNRENEEFEQLIIDDLKKKAGDIPIISVSHKPINLGTNICVGEVPVSYTNEWRQLLIGLKAAKTKYCMTAEADCLYPKSYFDFTPPTDNKMYYYDNLYIVWRRHNGFWKKTGHCEGAEICNREFWISRLEPLFGEGLGENWEPATRDEENKLVRQFFPKEDTYTGDPVISFKTGDGVSSRTTFINEKIRDVEYWGNIKDLKTKYFKPYANIQA